MADDISRGGHLSSSLGYSDLVTALGVALVANVPVILWGLPGQGKSSVIKGLAADLNLHVETIHLPGYEPADLAGLPVVDSTTGSVRRVPPVFAQQLIDAYQRTQRGGIVFFDEVSSATPAVQAVLLAAILDGRVGDVQLPPEVRRVAAANPPSIAVNGWDLDPPTANRFFHLTWSLPANVVVQGFTVGWPRVVMPAVDVTSVEQMVLPRIKADVAGFLAARPELVTRVPSDSTQAGLAFPTPRSWEMAARLYAVAEAAGCNTAVKTAVLAGAVGPGAASEFTAFLEELERPDLKKVLENPAAYISRGARADKVVALLGAVWNLVHSAGTVDTWQAFGDVLAQTAKSGFGDMAVLFGQQWARNRPTGAMPTEMARDALGPILQEMGRLIQAQ